MQTIIHKAVERGHVNFGWLDSHHSFSFGHYHDPAKMNFGALRVLNDDIVNGGGGFGTHPHDNMEIISIPLKGNLEHQDSTGTKAVIKEGDIQIMSAGTGIRHSEKNEDSDQPVNFLQIWILPKKRNIEPRYDQKTFDVKERKNAFQVIVSPQENEGIFINQDAWLSLGDLEKGVSKEYSIKKEGNGVYAFLIEGSAFISGVELNKRDAAGFYDTDKISITANENATILLIDVPMKPGN